MKIGVGITTYNKLLVLQSTLQNLKNTSTPFDLIVASDGSTDNTHEWLKVNKIPHIVGENKGIAYNKNRLLTAFQNYDFIFILENDTYPINSMWMQHYLDGLQYSGFHHFSYKFANNKSSLKRCIKVTYPSCTVLLSSGTSAQLMVFTHKVLEVCGGFNMEYIGYGYEHIEYSMRIMQAGLSHSTLFTDVLEGNLGLYTPPVTDFGLEQAPKYQAKIAHNKKIFKKFKKLSRRFPDAFRYREFRVPINLEVNK